MLKIFLTDRVDINVPMEFQGARLWTTRKFSPSEIKCLQARGIKRFYLPALSPENLVEFFGEFDHFWDGIVENFPSDHAFWRNGISSKMQAWEASFGYLAAALFVITRSSPTHLIIVIETLEEEDLIKEWAQRQKWTVLEPWQPPRLWRRGIQELKNFLMFIRLIVMAFQRKWFSAQSKNVWNQHKVLLVSMFYPLSFKEGEYKDPFFGALPEFLSKHEKSCAYLSDSISSPDRLTKMSVEQCHNVSVAMPLSLLSWGEWAAIFIRLFLRRITLPQSHFMGCDFSKLLSWQARSFKFFFNWHAEVYYEAVRKLSRQSFQELIVNFEGNVFERACLQGIQKSGLKSCGYSQGVLYPANLKLRMTLAECGRRLEPKRIVCTGPSAKESFVRISKNRKRDDVNSGCALREIPVNAASILSSASQVKNSKTILVALDGVYSTVAVLDWLCEQEDVLKDYRVHLRAHPNVPLKSLQKQCLGKIPSNFIASQGSLQENMQDCLCVLYRHTSIGLQALAQGKPVIHLNIDCPLPGDPLENVRAGKWVVRSARELKEALEAVSRLTQEDRALLNHEAEGLLKRYLAPPTEESMEDFLGDFLPEHKEGTCLTR